MVKRGDIPASPAPGPNVPNLRVTNRDARMKDVLAAVDAKHGAGTVIRLNDKMARRSHPVCPSGLLGFDKALGGGWPFGRFVEVYGPEGGGKTTLCLQAIAACQRLGGVAAFLDAEQAYDRAYATALGVDHDAVFVQQPDYGEQVFEVMGTLVEQGVNLIVVDSVAALVPKAELDGEITDQQMGLQARMMGKALRMMASPVAKAKTLVMFINQLRMKIGQQWGNPEDTPGGKALKYWASVRVDVRPIGKTKKGEDVVGHTALLKVVKNKLAPPFQKVEAGLVFGHGFWRAGEVIDLAVAHAIVEKSGAWFSYKGERLGQGRENIAAMLDTNAALLGDLETAVRAKLYEPAKES